MNLLEQKIRKQMIDETIRDFGASIGRGLGKLKDSKVGKGIGKGIELGGKGIELGGKGYRGVKKAAGFVAGLEDKTGLAGRVVGSATRAGVAAGIHAAVGRLSSVADQGLGGGDDRVGPTNTPMGAKADIARGSSDVKKAINPLRSMERMAGGDEIEDVDTALKKLGSQEASDFGKRQAEIRGETDKKIKDISSSAELDDIQKKAEINQLIRDRQDKLKQFDADTISKAVAKQRRSVGGQIATLAGGETEAEKASQFLKYLRGRDRDR